MVNAALLAWFALAPVAAAPSAEAVLRVAGALPKTGALTLADLAALGPVTATWVAHGGKHEVHGVPLDRVLTHFGFTPGSMDASVPKRDKRKGWHMVVIASAADGFQAVFSCAEIFETMGATRVLVVWKIDGKPLPPDRGPLRLVPLTDKEPSRSVFSVNRLEVIDPTAPPTR
jgi:DMSO/TMAO reductase YedYZ molybdopterin-dependent catalytic subunit